MKRLLIFLFILLVPSVLAAGTPELTLEAYYDAFMEENLGEYLETQVLDPSVLQERKDMLKVLWGDVEVLEYELKGMDVDEERGTAIAKYRLYSKLKIDGEEVENEVPIAALLVKDGDWKVVFTGDTQFVHSMLRQLITQEEMAEDLEDARDSGDEVTVVIPVEEDIEAASDDGGEAECGYDVSKFKGSQALSDFNLPEQFTKLFPQGSKIKIQMSKSYYGTIKGKDIAFGKDKDYDYSIVTDDCTMSYLLDGSVDALAAYKAGSLKVSSSKVFGKVKVTIAKIGLWFYGLFNPITKEFSIEAEEGTLIGGGEWSYISSSSRGPGELYLGEVSSAKYTFEAPFTGTAKLYLRVSDDGKHPDGARSVTFTINGREKAYDHEAATYTPWGWEELGVVLLEKENTLIIEKEKATSAAFVLDRMRFVKD